MLNSFTTARISGAWTILDPSGFPVRTYGDRGAAMRDAKRRNDALLREERAQERAEAQAVAAQRKAW